MKSRVLAISARADIGGGPEHLYTLSKGLISKHIVDIACPNQHPYWSKYSDFINGKVIEIPFRRLSILSVFTLASHIRKHNVSLIHSHGKGAGVYGRLLSLITGRPHLHTPHGIHTANYGKLMRAIYFSYEKISGFLNKHIIFVSQSEQFTAQSVGLWKKIPSHVIPNGVRVIDAPTDETKKQQLRKLNNTNRDDFVIVALSRFDIAKNMEEAARIAELLKNKAQIVFWFVGDGGNRKAVQEWCESQNIKNVRFPGFVDNPIDYLSAADTYLSTSRWEGLPLAVLEAMSLGLPVVATDVVGNKDAVSHEYTGYLYPLSVPLDAANYLHGIFSDAQLRARLSIAAKIRQTTFFSTETMVLSTESVYKFLLKS